MQLTNRTRPIRRAALTVSGLTQPKTCEVSASCGYYIGGSSSPSFVIVLAVTPESVTYCDAHSLDARREQRWIFEDLAARAGETMRAHATQAAANAKGADTSKAMGRLAIQVAAMCAWRADAHGAPVSLESFDRIRVTMTADEDVYPFAERLGAVASVTEDSRTATVDTNNRDFGEFVKDGLAEKWPVKVVLVETVKSCPRA